MPKTRQISGKVLTKLSTDNHRRTPPCPTKQQWRLHRTAKSNTISTHTIHSITFENKSYLDVCDNYVFDSWVTDKDINIQDHLIEIIKDIYPTNKSELKNLKIQKETPGHVLQAIFERLTKKHKVELFLTKRDIWTITQKESASIDFHHLAIDELIMCCDSNWEFIECLVYTVSLLKDYCHIDYTDNKEYKLECEVENFQYDSAMVEFQRVNMLRRISDIRFGFFNYFNKCVEEFKITPPKYLKKIKQLKPQCQSQEQLFEFFHEAYDLSKSGYTVDQFNSVESDGYVQVDQMMRFVWSTNNDPLMVSEELIDLANNSGWDEPTFYNDITETSKEVVVPDEFYKFLKLMNDARFKKT